MTTTTAATAAATTTAVNTHWLETQPKP